MVECILNSPICRTESVWEQAAAEQSNGVIKAAVRDHSGCKGRFADGSPGVLTVKKRET